MKLLLIIDGERREIPVHAFEISYNKYEEFDAVILIDTPASVQDKIVEATDVRRPSKGGIQEWIDIIDAIPIKDIYSDEKDSPLYNARIDNSIKIISELDPKDEILQKDLTIISDSFDDDNIIAVLDSIPVACRQLAGREKAAAADHYLYIIEEPYLKKDEQNKYRIIEKVSVFKKPEPVENTEQSQE